MKTNKILMSALVLLAVWLTPRAVKAQIYRVSLTEHKPIIALSQQFSLEVLGLGDGREDIFVELTAEPDSLYTLKLLPATATVDYRLIDSAPEHDTTSLVQTLADSATDLPRESSDATSTAYRHHDTVLHFKRAAREVTDSRIHPTALRAQSVDGMFAVTFKAVAVKSGFTLGIEKKGLLPIPADLTLVSSIYQYDVKNKENLDTTIPISVKIKYSVVEPASKSLYFFDKIKQQWQKLPSYHNVETHEIDGQLYLPYAPIAILAENNAFDGIASWYGYKNCLCAASRIYPKGSKVQVTRLKTNKSIIVRINDYGPEEWTKRVIDLDKVAFTKLGTQRAGLIYVRVQLLSQP